MNQNQNIPSRPFLLMEGGPLFTLQKRVGIIREDAPFRKRRAIIAALITWPPLFVLAAIQGRAFGHSVAVPFVRDISAYTRFFLAIPLLLLAENILGPRIADAAAHFVTSALVIEKDYKKFDEYVVRALQARDSALAEIVIAILAYFFTFVAFKTTAVHADSWYALHGPKGGSLTLAGIWLTVFCIPLFQFLVLRWLWRLFLWFQFLARVRDLDLQLYPTHPDKAGGLGFIGEAQRFFGIILFAVSIASTGVLANDILYDRIPLKSFAPAIIVYVIIVLLIVVGPLIIFTGKLLKIKRIGLHQYGTFATEYTGDFHKKWIDGENPGHEPLLGTGDIQSLADLGNSYNLVEKMTPIPIDPIAVIHLVAASVLPMAPLLLTVMPLKDVLKLVFKFIA